MKIAVICMGNICRSPIGEYVLRCEASNRGIALEVCSGGTGDWHIGEPAHENSVEVLAAAGYDASAHRARQFDTSWFDGHDLVLVMDQQNLEAVAAQARDDGDLAKVRLLRSFDPASEPFSEVSDPYGFGLDSYERVLKEVQTAINGLLTDILADDADNP